MRGFNTLNKDFDEATCEMHLYSKSGRPTYLVTTIEGKYDIVLGTLVDGNETKIVGYDDNNKPITVPIQVPGPTPVVLGCEVTPCKVALRAPSSPDAKLFREKRNNTVDAMDVLGAGKDKDENGNSIIPSEDKLRIWWASQIADFINLPHKVEKTDPASMGKEGDVVLAKYTEDDAIKFINDAPFTVSQMQKVIFDPKNFERPLAG